MRRQVTGFVLMVCGVIALGFGFTVGPAPTPVAAMPALQPSPRPTLVPTPDPRDDDYNYPTPIPFGRITGTVIDTRTGAPAANQQVLVGDKLVTTDANGNYDVWVAAGRYTVLLQLSEEAGTAAQWAQEVAVWGSDTVVLHLFYSSQAPEPTAGPLVAIPVPTALAEPAAPPPAEPTAAPVVRPTTPPVAVARPGVVAPVPAGLPVTAAAGNGLAGALLVGGMVLLGVGAALQAVPRRRRAVRARADRQMLGTLLETTPKPTAEETLRDLLDSEPR